MSFAEAILDLEAVTGKISKRDFSLEFSRGHFFVETDQNAFFKTPGVEIFRPTSMLPTGRLLSSLAKVSEPILPVDASLLIDYESAITLSCCRIWDALQAYKTLKVDFSKFTKFKMKRLRRTYYVYNNF